MLLLINPSPKSLSTLMLLLLVEFCSVHYMTEMFNQILSNLVEFRTKLSAAMKCKQTRQSAITGE